MSLIRAAASWLVEPPSEARTPADRRLDPAHRRPAFPEHSGRPDLPGHPGRPDHPDRPGRPDLPSHRAAGHLELLTNEPGAATPHAALTPLVRPAVLGTAATAPPLAAAVALACRARARMPAALVALWPATDAAPAPAAVRSGPALPGAAALAARLHRRDLPVVARGRLVWLALPADPDAAPTLLRHAEAAAGDLPTVLAIARPRDPAVDELLAERDVLVVATPAGSALSAAVLADAVELGLRVHASAPQPPGAARLATLAGLRAPRLDLTLAAEART